MNSITFLVRLKEPVLATQASSSEPNSATAYPFIPGSMIRGAMIHRYLDGQNRDAADPTFRNLFLKESLCYLNAYPAHPYDNTRMLPKPKSWFVKKDEVGDPAAEILDCARMPRDQEDRKPPRGDFCWRGSEAVQLGTPKLQMTVHNTSSCRDLKNEETSDVYRYEAIAAGEVFAGAIISQDEKPLSEQLLPLLDDPSFRFGGSYTGGYGLVEICDVDLDTDWREYQPDLASPESDEEATDQTENVAVTCLSDVIVRNRNGQTDGDLSEIFDEQPLRAFRRTRLVGGFNRKWGLPLSQAWAIEAGSVFVYPAACKTMLQEYAESGLGERRAEGFGRIALDWHRRDRLHQSELPERRLSVTVPSRLSPDSQELAQRMADRRLQMRIDSKLRERISRLTDGHSFRGLPSVTQLSRARIAARLAWHSGDLKVIEDHFNSLSDLTKREWSRARVRNKPLESWIRNEIDNHESFQAELELPVVAGQTADFTKLRNKTLARLIEGVLKRAIEAAKERTRGGQ